MVIWTNKSNHNFQAFWNHTNTRVFIFAIILTKLTIIIFQFTLLALFVKDFSNTEGSSQNFAYNLSELTISPEIVRKPMATYLWWSVLRKLIYSCFRKLKLFSQYQFFTISTFLIKACFLLQKYLFYIKNIVVQEAGGR